MTQLIQNTKKIGQLIALILLSFSVSGQSNNCIQGQIVNGLTKKPIPFASVVLLHSSGSSQVKGTMSEMNGEFRFCTIQKGKYILEISHVGFKTNQQKFHFTGNSTYNAGIIHLIEKTTGIEKVVILGERVKAKDEGDKITYFINKKIQKASNTGVDVLKLIPGVQLDMMQNLSLEGGQNIIILVNGRERDLNFIRQLSGAKIDKIEINTSPGAEYSSDINGVINVVLKDKETGISGYVNAEIPTSPSEVYLFPNYSIQYGIQKFNFFTSYTGELSYFDITNRNHRSFLENNENNSIRKVQHVRQKNWSHRFNLGMDYQINEKNQINLYGYYNPFSQEHDGKTLLETQGSAMDNIYWLADKEDTDKSRVAFFSMYYNHLFAENQKFTVDLSYYNFQAENTTQYAIDSASGIDNKNIVSTRKPGINTALIKMDYTTPIKENWRINVGLKNTYKRYQDTDSELFNQHENIFAFYGNTSYSGSLFHLKAGLRYEQSVTKMKQQFNQTNSLFLPSVKLNYKISKKKNLTLSYRSGVYRPNVYQLNPSVVYNDPFSMENGNPGLNNESRHHVYLDYSIRPGSNFVSSRIFFQKTMQTINKLTVINGDNMFESFQHNLGSMEQYGIQFTGAWAFGKSFSVQPYLKLYNLHTLPNEFAMQHGIIKRRGLEFESGLSAIITLNNELTATLRYQYNSPRAYMQSSVYSDALYFLSVDKTIRNNFKLGLTCGIPFNRSFTYYGKDVEGGNFSSHWESNIQTSGFPVWLKLSYHFKSGRKINKIQRKTQNIEQIPRKGF